MKRRGSDQREREAKERAHCEIGTNQKAVQYHLP